MASADKEDRAWKWKLKWAQRQLNNLQGIENDAAASHSAIRQTAASNASACRLAAGAEAKAAAATHSAMGQAASNAGACRVAAGAKRNHQQPHIRQKVKPPPQATYDGEYSR